MIIRPDAGRIAVGERAVHIPYHVTWALEEVDPTVAIFAEGVYMYQQNVD